jgi:hypothetical protein
MADVLQATSPATRTRYGCGAFAAAETEHRRLAAATAAAQCTLAEVEAVARRALDTAAAAVAVAELAEAAALTALKQLPEYALAASPFALLDAHGCLRLVTDVVHEDDALCLALVCRVMHDALGARFPACPRAGGREVARLAAMMTSDGVLDLSRDLSFRDPDASDDDRSDDGGDGGLRALPKGLPFGRLAYLHGRGLRVLHLDSNGGRIALPEGLWALAGLEVLDLNNCGLRALPEGVGALTGLRKLDLSRNWELTALPEGLCALAGLEELELAYCGLTALPAGIVRLVGLRTLDLRHNDELTLLPAGLGLLRNLEVLNLGDCPGLATLRFLRLRDGLSALLAHLAAQGEPTAGEAS